MHFVKKKISKCTYLLHNVANIQLNYLLYRLVPYSVGLQKCLKWPGNALWVKYSLIGKEWAALIERLGGKKKEKRPKCVVSTVYRQTEWGKAAVILWYCVRLGKETFFTQAFWPGFELQSLRIGRVMWDWTESRGLFLLSWRKKKRGVWEEIRARAKNDS